MTDFFGDSVSHTTVSSLAEHGRLLARNSRSVGTCPFFAKLDIAYSAIFCDCLFITVRRGDRYEKEAVYVAYGVTARNTRELSALSISPTESMTVWREIFSSLKNRGGQNVSLVIADGITGMEDGVMEAWSQKCFIAKIQKCVVHKMRNVLGDIRPKNKKAVVEDLQ